MPSNLGNILKGTLSTKLFKALGDTNRVAILAYLAECKKPCTVSEIADFCPVNFSVVSRHLSLLRDAGILVSEKQGKNVYYKVQTNDLVQTLHAIADAVEKCCVVPSAKTMPAKKTTWVMDDPAENW